MSKTLYRTSLTLAKKKQLLHKIKAMHLIIRKGAVEHNSQGDLANLAVDETVNTASLIFRGLPGAKKASATIGDLTFTADTAGVAGNAVTVRFVNPGTASASLSVSVTGSAITVNLATTAGSVPSSTATQIKAAVDAASAAQALVDTAVSGTGATVQTAKAATSLKEGADNPALETYDLADIIEIKRLRTRKWLIILNPDANAAA